MVLKGKKMEDTFKIRKDRIKNIAIIFLTIMLVLTFFSNSILNYSLPEVATQYVQSGTITEKVRGTGTITADDPYKVTTNDTRTIESVAVKKGDVVTKDQVLFVLEDKDSDELTKAQAELDALVFAYTQKILAGDISANAFSEAQNGTSHSITEFQARIQAANDKVTAAQTKVNTLNNNITSIQKQIDLLDNKVVDTTSEKAAFDTATSNYNSAQQKVTETQTALDTAKKNGSALGTLAEAQLALDNAKAAFEAALQAYTNTPTMATKDEYDRTSTEYDEAQQKITAINNSPAEIAAAEAKLTSAKQNAQSLLDALNSAKSAYENVNNASSSNKNSKSDLSNQLIEEKANLTAATATLEAAKTEQTSAIKDVQTQLDLGNQNSLIADKEEEVAKLKEKATGATINSPVDGIMTEISKAAGETTVPAEAVATIQVAGKGFTVSFSVTNEQAKKVKVGDVADLQNAWYYEDVKATLAKIKPDTEDPGKKKLLIFNVEGSIQDGESLSLSLGQKSANYDYVVPNSAVREDKNGKFILIIEQKSTPFGNRYKARKVEAEVLASDDNQTAISAQLEGYEYVITTSNKPVEAGQQVRLADN